MPVFCVLITTNIELFKSIDHGVNADAVLIRNIAPLLEILDLDTGSLRLAAKVSK
ncbi:hypothetical protein HGG72_05590 [Ochrobactrum pecoris]|nr:hypothetical protein [Brucella pecoris]